MSVKSILSEIVYFGILTISDIHTLTLLGKNKLKTLEIYIV